MKTILSLCLLFATTSVRAASYGVSSQDGQTTVTVTLGQITGTASVAGLTDTSSMTVYGSLNVNGTGGVTAVGPLTVQSSASITGATGGYGLLVSSNVSLAGASVLTNNGNVALTGNETIGGTLDVTGHTTLATANTSSLTSSSLTVTGNAFSVGGSTLVVTGGKVGIGASPSYAFDVVSGTTPINFTGVRILNNTNTGGSISAASLLLGLTNSTANKVYGKIEVSENTSIDDDKGKMSFYTDEGNNLTEKVSIRALGGLKPYSRTLAQLQSLAVTVGEVFFCSNCTPVKLVLSTGTAAGNFASIDGGTFE